VSTLTDVLDALDAADALDADDRLGVVLGKVHLYPDDLQAIRELAASQELDQMLPERFVEALHLALELLLKTPELVNMSTQFTVLAKSDSLFHGLALLEAPDGVARAIPFTLHRLEAPPEPYSGPKETLFSGQREARPHW